MRKSIALFVVALIFGSLILGTTAVDRSKFKKCDQAHFCKRNRQMADKQNPSFSLAGPLTMNGDKAIGNVLHPFIQKPITIEFSAIKNDILRMKVSENHPKRYQGPPEVLIPFQESTLSISKVAQDHQVLAFGDNEHAIVFFNPFKVEIYQDDELVISVNNRNLFNFEPILDSKENDYIDLTIPSADATKPETWNEEMDGIWEPPAVANPAADGRWEESFGGTRDSKPNGPTAVALDFTFEGSRNVYGIPEHTSDLSLKPTRGKDNQVLTDPYRLYNLDVFEYELNSEMALYGAVPLMISHSPKKTAAIFWLNAAETWIDIHEPVEEGSTERTHTHWISESGIIDVFFLTGPTPSRVFTQYTSLTGTTAFPPLFSLGNHQCKWNYRDQKEVKEVNDGYEAINTPLDVIWLDIEHTDGKKYFTWDKHHFPTPLDMLKNMSSYGRRMVTIVDPHIKRDQGYDVHSGASAEGIYVKNVDGNEFEGHCWPGSSSWIDYTNPKAREWWGKRFDYNVYAGSAENLFIWNDMNEPSVFTGPEITMNKDALHFGGVEHRDVHNVYGLLFHKSTFDGLTQRNKGANERPFVLSRAFFAGSQKFGAIWTGDNAAQWGHLAAAQPMLLSMNLAGIPFIGSDIGGFFGNPEPELMSRWYQTAAFHPFFRSHGHIETKRREPFLYDQPYQGYMTTAIKTRYALLPLFYTLFYKAATTGSPVLNPLWVEFPQDTSIYAEQQTFMLGQHILVRAISSPHRDQQEVEVILPGSENDVWYDFHTKAKYQAPNRMNVKLSLDRIPVYYRGGFIVPSQERVRRSSTQMLTDPYTLTVSLDGSHKAQGELFMDDGHSFNYKNGAFIHRKFTFASNKLVNSAAAVTNYQFTNKVERINVLGVYSAPRSVVLTENGKTRNLEFTFENGHLTIRNPNVMVAHDWEISLQ